jgi:hypothetical protein
MPQFLLGVISTVLFGTFGWIAIEFIGRPVRNFLDLRRQIRHQTLRLANVGVPERPSAIDMEPGSPEQDQHERAMEPVRKAQSILRELGVRAMAFGETEWAAAKVLRLMQLDPVGAGQALIGLSNVYDQYGEERAAHRAHLAKALRFPF